MKKTLRRIVSVLLLHALPVWAAPQNHAEIREVVTAFVRAQTASLPGEVTIKVGEIDRRLVIPACASREAYLPPGGKLFGNGTVGVRCLDDKKGRPLFVPVHIKVTANLLISRQSLQAGQTLSAEDLASQSGEMTQTSILTDPAQAIGKVLKYGLGAGQALRQDMLRAPYAVTQGQTVQLHVDGSGFSVQSTGQALNNGAEGQSIQVRTSTGQVVSGTVRADGTVSMRP